MAYTKVADVIEPSVFVPYMIQKTTETNAFLASGIATPDENIILDRGGRTVNLPFWKDLGGTNEVLSDSNALTVNKVDAFADIAAIHARGVAYGFNNLAGLIAGDDPMRVIADKLAGRWSKDIEKVLISSLNGVFGVAGLAGSVADHSTDVLSSSIMTQAMFLLGDNFEKITAIAMHSAVLAKLQELDLIETFKPSEQTTIRLYAGRRVIVDDALVPTSGVYPVYFFGEGAFAFNENTTASTVKTDEDILEDTVVVASRRIFTMHPRGVKWVGNAAGLTPTDAELATAANWALVEDRKNVALAKLLVKVEA
ncbi:MAG: hypothetical protein J6S85_19580 [Methanobrevibacter sp.]|nr:hypothetical protein [Methanobrevibacter sp.]